MLANYGPILLAAVVSFVFGAVWYGALSKPWLEALGKSEEEIRAGGRPTPALLAITLAAEIVMAWVLAGILVHLARGGFPVSVRHGLFSAGLCWLGFVATTLVVNHGYGGQRPKLTLIDGGHWLGVLLLQGLVLGWWGVR